MPTKTTGAEFKRFYTDDKHWPQDDGNTYHEDENVLVNGELHNGDYESIEDSAIVTVEGGMMFGPAWDYEDSPSFETYFKRWRKLQATEFLVVEAPKEKIDAIKAAVRAAGGKTK